MADDVKKLIDRVFFPAGWEEAFAGRLIDRFRNSWSEQSPTVRKTRMRYVLAMAAELAEIRKTENFSTAMCEWAIEAVIMGDIPDLKNCIEWLSEKEFAKNIGDDEEGARYAEIFAKFRDICEEAHLILTPNPTEMKS